MTETRRAAPAGGASTAAVWSALSIVYVVWGSTYLAIRIVVTDMPPLLSAGARFALAGVLLALAVAVRRGWRRLAVTRRQLLGCALVGALLPAGGNGLVSVGEDIGVPSGLAALLIASVPLWLIVYRTASGDRPQAATLAGVGMGFAGLTGLVVATGITGAVRPGGVLLVVVAAVCWSFGSWSQSRLALPADPFVTAAYEMLVGGAVMLVASLLLGEPVEPSRYGAASWAAWTYLVVFGSLLAFTAYFWVLRHAPISLVATYAYVNPVVAVLLGSLVLDEPLTVAIAVGGGIVVASVALVVSAERPPPSGEVR